MTDELSIEIKDRKIYGWTGVRLTRGIEVFPSHFEITLTEKFPDSAFEIVLKPGDACKVFFGGDLVLTGFIDRYGASIDAHNHEVTIIGRSKCEDLIDCSAYFGPAGTDIPLGNIYGISGIHTSVQGSVTITDLAERLVAPFSLSVTNRTSDRGKPLPPFTINLGETPYDILTRVGRFSGFLIMDDTDGNLILDRAGSTQMASGFKQGQNAQNASVLYSIDQRFSDYYVIDQSVWSQANVDVNIRVQHSRDPENIRFRPIYRISNLFFDNQGDGLALAQQEAQWEANRNWGRSQAISLTTDSWRDSKGALWKPNAMVNVDMPSVKTANKTWIIAQVTFMRSLDTGTTADLVLMPKEAFDIEPILLQPPLPANLQPKPPDPILEGAPT